MTSLSAVIPTLDEAVHISRTLEALSPLRRQGLEIVVADGGSNDGTPEIAHPLADAVVKCPVGRARQMNAGASWSRGEVIWFLHADTSPPENALQHIQRAVQDGADWGWFDIRLSGYDPALRVIERCMNVRARLSGVATGDQGLFVRRSVFRAIGGFPDIALMEDVAISKRLRSSALRKIISAPLITSSRRWERDGVLRTVLLMWRLRLAYFLGVDPDELVGRYYGKERMETP